jgi:hypothetical protein
MSDKLNHSKFILLILLLGLFTACQKQIFNTEILCPDGSRILVRYSNAEEVRFGIQKAYNEKKKYGTGEDYTAVKMPHQRSFKVEKIAPEEMIKCSLRQSLIGTVERDYIHYSR